MNFYDYRLVFVAVTGILVLLVASPAMSRLLVLPRTESFTEFWVLGSNHKAEDYPFSVTPTNNYNVFLGIGNHLGRFAYYLVEVKFRNQTQSAPSSFNRTSSSLPSLFNITAFVADEESWELPLTFSFNYTFAETPSRMEIDTMTFNSVELEMHSYALFWDSNRTGFFGNLFFELWIYDSTASGFQYHERFLGLWFNLTSS